MSQQSTLKMMLPYFARWMISFPKISDLARADVENVLRHWEGLGYYSRARNIHRAAQLLEKKFPQTPGELLELPGVGPYTAAAIAAIAFDYPALPVDGNVIRVLARLFGITNPLNAPADLREIRILAEEIARQFPRGERGALAHAFMELGALVCRPGEQARCEECPLRNLCWAYARTRVPYIPAPKLRQKMLKISRLLLIYRNSRGEILLRRRSERGVLGGQWEIPYLDLTPSDEWIGKSLGKSFELGVPFKHTIMHRAYTLWPLELGAFGVPPADHQYNHPKISGVLSTTVRKFIQSNDPARRKPVRV